MSDQNAQPQPGSTPPATQTVRTFKDAADAEKARAMLKAEGIEAAILDLALPPGHHQRSSGGVRLVVDSDQASRATQLLLRHLREQQPNAPSKTLRRPQPRVVPQGRFASTALFVLIGITGAAFATWYFTSQFGGAKRSGGKRGPQPDRYVYEDINHDGNIDARRVITAEGAPIREEWDVNFDGKWDMRRNFAGGRLSVRAMDTDGNGITDEETYYDSAGRPFYSQLIPNGKGAVRKRIFYQDAELFEGWEPDPELAQLLSAEDPRDPVPLGGEVRPVRILLDDDADGHFDREQQLDLKGQVKSERKLEKNAPENQIPPFP